MSEPSAPRPCPGPGRPVPGPAAPPADRPVDDAVGSRFAELDGRPVAEHVEVFEAEHDRLKSGLGTIDRV
jgi:hypothetical protein